MNRADMKSCWWRAESWRWRSNRKTRPKAGSRGKNPGGLHFEAQGEGRLYGLRRAELHRYLRNKYAGQIADSSVLQWPKIFAACLIDYCRSRKRFLPSKGNVYSFGGDETGHATGRSQK